MKEFFAYCGLDCECCGARLATVNGDDALRRKVAEEWSALNGVEITPDNSGSRPSLKNSFSVPAPSVLLPKFARLHRNLSIADNKPCQTKS